MSFNNIQDDLSRPSHLKSTETEEAEVQKITAMKEIKLFSPEQLEELKVIYAGCKDYKTLNEYRELRTKLLKRSHNKNFVAMISSINMGAGATHIALNLAASIALDHNKTALIIDCNTHSTGISEHLTIPTSLGLTNFLAQDTDEIEKIIYQSGIPRVRIIPAGIRTDYAAEYFSSEKMIRFINKIKHRYPDRFIILDTPPIELYAESQILASLCDFSILVIRYGQASQAQVKMGISIIGEEKLAGLIFNK